MKRVVILSLVLFLVDQLTKFLLYGREIPLFPYVSVHSVQNTGVIFGLFQGNNVLFIIISIAVLVLVWRYLQTYPVALSLLVAGTVGNIVDRIFFGYVRDFISVSVWPVFNLADAYVSVAVILLLYSFWREDKAYKVRGSKER